MSDAAVEVKPPPQFKPAETLAFGGEAEGSVLQRPEIRAAQEKAKQLRKLKEEGATGRQIFETVAGRVGEARLSGQDAEGLKLKFGAGEATRETDGSIKTPESEEAKLSFEAAQQAIKTISDFLQYSEIALEVQRTGKSIERVLKDRRDKNISGPRNTAEWQRLRENALDSLINLDTMQEMFPQLMDITDAQIKRNYIETTLASDPKLRIKVTEKMNGILQTAQNFTEIQKDSEFEQAKQDKEDAEKQISEGADEIVKMLDEIGITDTDEVKTQLQKLVSNGRSLDASMNYLRGTLLTEQRIPALRQITTYLQAKNAVETIEKELANYNTTRTLESLIESKKQALEKVTQAIKQFEDNSSTDTNLQQQLELYISVSRLVTTQRETSGVYLSPIAEELNEMVGAKRKANEAQKMMTAKESEATQREKGQRQKRLREESGAINDLEQVLSGSIAEVMMERYDEMVALEEQRQIQEEEKALKEKGEKVANGIKVVGKKMNGNWISYDKTTRKKTVRRSQIGRDIRFPIYESAEGVKRLILRDLDLRDANGQPIQYESVDLSALPDEQKNILEEVYKVHGEAYMKKLMTDYFAARNWADKTVTFFGHEGTIGDLALKSHEWQLLEQNFPTLLENGLKNSQEAQQVLKTLKEKGIPPSSRLKWLLWILALLGIGAGAIVAGPLGGGLAAGAAGGVAGARGIQSGDIGFA